MNTKTVGGKPPVFMASYEAKQIAERLIKAAKDERYEPISYDELTAICGYNTRGEGRGYLRTAIKIAEAATNRLFGCVRRVGIKLLEPCEQVAQGTDTVNRIRRASKRGLHRAGKVEYARLTEAEKNEHNTSASLMGALHMLSAPKAVKKITDSVSKASEKLAVDGVLKLFGIEG